MNFNFFDCKFLSPSLIEENLQADEDEKIFIRATVQAMALKLSDSEVEKAVSLVEGGFAYQNAMFKNSEHFVLKSEGVTLPDIERLAPVDEGSITTENGSLIWTYTTQKTFVFNQEIVELTEAKKSIHIIVCVDRIISF